MEPFTDEELFPVGFFTILESKQKRVYRTIISFIYQRRQDNRHLYRRLFPGEIRDYLSARVSEEEIEENPEDEEKPPVDYTQRISSYLSFLNDRGWIRFNRMGSVNEEEVVLTEDARSFLDFEQTVRERKEQGRLNTLRSLWAQMRGIRYTDEECSDMISEFCTRAQSVLSGLFGLEDSLEHRAKEFYDTKREANSNFVEQKNEVKKLVGAMMDNFEMQEKIIIGDNCSVRYIDPCEEFIEVWQDHQEEIVRNKLKGSFDKALLEKNAAELETNLKRLVALFSEIRNEGMNVSEKMTLLNAQLVEKLSFLYISIVDSIDLDVIISKVISSMDTLDDQIGIIVGYNMQGMLAKKQYREDQDTEDIEVVPVTVPAGNHEEDATVHEKIAAIEKFSPLRIDRMMLSLFREKGKSVITSEDFPIADMESFTLYCCSLVRGVSSPLSPYRVEIAGNEEYMTRTIDTGEKRLLPVFRFTKNNHGKGGSV